MKKNNLSVGFLYHPSSQKFLLQQKLGDASQPWTLLEDLKKFSVKAIWPVYDYVAKGQKCFVFYSAVKNLKNFPNTKNSRFGWFTLKEISKLPLSPQTKQDLIVGQRVIASEVRRDAGEQTIG